MINVRLNLLRAAGRRLPGQGRLLGGRTTLLWYHMHSRDHIGSAGFWVAIALTTVMPVLVVMLADRTVEKRLRGKTKEEQWLEVASSVAK
ncbi:Hypp8126 [Branchiostoma lanceolatum]|uniref:Hypp8126 protein n=1 Tax=Branchiostoma lanceolatum TaxID=7740 RepID=A0A8K0ECZ3_BRALA|nr:Hypp8126 [Branchiostoma lanceolatum]